MILTTDLHLTDRERDEYRWGIFPWLAEQIASGCSVWGADRAVLILGDLTDAKDGHSARLVNRTIDALVDLPVPAVYVLMGNHDYRNEQLPFFRFLDREELGSKLTFITRPRAVVCGDMRVLMLPHTPDPVGDWTPIAQCPWDELHGELYEDLVDGPGIQYVDAIGCHQTFRGSVAENDTDLRSELPSTFWSELGFEGPVFAGDVHVPQEVGDVTYVGCPYPKNFGDSFKPRVLRVSPGDDGALVTESLYPPSISRWSLELGDVEELGSIPGLGEGDQIKVKVRLPRAEFGFWEREYKPRLLEIAREHGAQVFSARCVEEGREEAVEPASESAAPAQRARSNRDLLHRFCEERGIDETLEWFGRNVLEAVR